MEGAVTLGAVIAIVLQPLRMFRVKTTSAETYDPMAPTTLNVYVPAFVTSVE